MHCAKRAFGSGDVTHGTRLRQARLLLRSATRPGATLGRLYPDLLIGPIKSPTAIIDAKYKPLVDPRGVDREDLYQLTTYLMATTAQQPAAGMLAYPRFAESAPPAHAEACGPWRSPQDHHVRFERLPVIEHDCVDRLTTLGHATRS